jgi:BASS family bile acid:Na+ symporter
VPGRSLTVVALAAQSNARLLRVSAAITNLFPVWVRHARLVIQASRCTSSDLSLIHALLALCRWRWELAWVWSRRQPSRGSRHAAAEPVRTRCSADSRLGLQGSSITAALAVTMLGMGLTMEAADMVEALQSPRQVAVGVALQFSVMPLLAFAISRLLPLPTPLAVGLILVGCCPGGTASNLVTYIAKANVALSVVLTAASTLLASVATPALCAALAGTLVPVPAAKLMASTAQVVLAPVALGLVLKRVAPKAVAAVAPLCPPVAVATVTLICASVIGGSAEAVRSAGPLLLLAVVLLHAGGFLFGYLGAAAAGYNEQTRRTVSIEVGMQNSALGCVLALAHFADPTTAVPAAISATAHSVIGSALAGAWRAQDAKRGV